MRKRFTKAAALITCFAVVSFYVPLTYAGTNSNYNLRIINIPAELLTSIFFFLPAPVNTIGYAVGINKISVTEGSNIRTTGEIPIHRIGAGD